MRLPKPAVFLGLAAAAYAVPFAITGTYVMRLIDLAVIWSVYALSLNIVMGYTGLINLGQAAFLGAGAYASGLLTARAGLPFWAGVLGALGVGAVLGVVVGVPSLRIGGHYLALVTLAFTQIAFVLEVNLRPVTGGYDGLPGIPPPSLFGRRLDNVWDFYPLALTALLLVAAGSLLLRHSHLGRAMLALKEDEAMARSLGVRALRLKTLAFVWCASVAAVAGSLYAHLYGYVSPDSFTIGNSILVLAMVLVGGLGRVGGVITGAVLLTFLPEALRFMGDAYPVVYALLLIGVVLFLPGGLADAFTRGRAMVRLAALRSGRSADG